MEPLESAPAEAAPTVQEQKPVASEALEKAEKAFEKRAMDGISSEELVEEVSRLAEQGVSAENIKNNQWSQLVGTEGAEAQQQAQDSAIEAGRMMEEGKKQLTTEVQAKVGGGEMKEEKAAAGAESENEELKKALAETDAIVKDFESRPALDAVGQAYLELMRTYRGLLDAQLRNAAPEAEALLGDYEQKLNAYQALTAEKAA